MKWATEESWLASRQGERQARTGCGVLIVPTTLDLQVHTVKDCTMQLYFT